MRLRYSKPPSDMKQERSFQCLISEYVSYFSMSMSMSMSMRMIMSMSMSMSMLMSTESSGEDVLLLASLDFIPCQTFPCLWLHGLRLRLFGGLPLLEFPELRLILLVPVEGWGFSGQGLGLLWDGDGILIQVELDSTRMFLVRWGMWTTRGTVRCEKVWFWSSCWENERLHLFKLDARLSLQPTPWCSHAITSYERNIMPILNCEYASNAITSSLSKRDTFHTKHFHINPPSKLATTKYIIYLHKCTFSILCCAPTMGDSLQRR